MNRIRACVLVVAAAAAIASVTVSSLACEPSITDPSPGVLSRSAQRDSTVPRSVAFYTSRSTPKSMVEADTWLPARLADGQVVPASVVLRVGDAAYGSAVVKPREPLPANTTIDVFSWAAYEDRVVTDENIDVVPPTPPTVSGGSVQQHDGEWACGGDSCGDYTFMKVRLDAPGRDDVTAQEELVYAIFLGSTSEEAATKPDADTLHTGASVSAGELYQNLDDSYWTHDVFVSIAALDQSGNLSVRTKPLKIHSGDGEGCALSGRPRRLGGLHSFVGIVALVGLARRLLGSKGNGRRR